VEVTTLKCDPVARRPCQHFMYIPFAPYDTTVIGIMITYLRIFGDNLASSPYYANADILNSVYSAALTLTPRSVAPPESPWDE
jgi:hypothetical protein